MLLVENERAANRIENLSRLHNVVCCRVLTCSNGSHPFFNKTRSIRHRPNDRHRLIDDRFHEPSRHARCDGDHDVIRREVIRNLA